MNLDDDEFSSAYEDVVTRFARPSEVALRDLLLSWRDPGQWADFRPEGGAFPNPVQRVKSRIKRPESVIDKSKKLGSEFEGKSPGRILREMRDLVGARVITFVPLHLPMVDQMIREHPSLKLVSPKPRAYMRKDDATRVGLNLSLFEFRGAKPSGYSSIHYFVKVRLGTGSWSRVVELQLRTMVEEVWAEIEHQLGYKMHQATDFSVTRQFRVISSHLNAINEHFDFLYDRLTYLQTQTTVTPDDVLNAENLPSVLSNYEVPIAQDEVSSLLSILNVWDVVTVEDLRKRVTTERLDRIRTAFRRQVHDEHLTAFHVLSTLAMVHEEATLDDVERQLLSNLAMVKLTRKTRKRDQ